MTIALLVMTDGRRDCIELTLESLNRNVGMQNIGEMWIHDDSGDPEYRAWLRTLIPNALWNIIGPEDGRSGFGGAIRSAWSTLRAESSCSHVFHVEDDFIFRRYVALSHLQAVLDREPLLVQMALRRQAWNPVERAAGGVVETQPEAYDDVTLQIKEHGQVWRTYRWLEHQLFFTTNPSLYRRSLIDRFEWPAGEQSEGRFTAHLRETWPNSRFGYWGERSDEPWVEHIGVERVGTGY